MGFFVVKTTLNQRFPIYCWRPQPGDVWQPPSRVTARMNADVSLRGNNSAKVGGIASGFFSRPLGIAPVIS